MAHLAFTFTTASSEQSEQILGWLQDFNFNGFLEQENALIAYANETDFDETNFAHFAAAQQLNYTKSIIQNENWNAIWESSFEPIEVPALDGDGIFASIRADFHPKQNHAQYDLVITPKMSFGTGHHPTTFQMVQEMSTLNFAGKKVIDYGTGTGVLAILAEKLGANEIEAIDYDQLCYDNTLENIEANQCHKIITILSEHCSAQNEKADILLANINLNVIIAELNNILSSTKPGAVLLFSGILKENQEVIYNQLLQHAFQNIQIKSRENWLLISCVRP